MEARNERLHSGTHLEVLRLVPEELEQAEVWYALVADDDEDWRALISTCLRRAGFQVCEANDGDELLQRFQALQSLHCRYLVVISDVNMPGTDGVAATEALRSISSDVPIVIITGNSSAETLAAAHRAGANCVLSKPMPGADLVDAVRAVIGENAHA
jgi:CheY-like chemotaxis protein